MGGGGGEGKGLEGGLRGPSAVPRVGEPLVDALWRILGAFFPTWVHFLGSTLRQRGCRGAGKLGNELGVQGTCSLRAIPLVPTAHPCPTEEH